MKNEYAIEIHDLTKEIDGKAILSGITMNIKKRRDIWVLRRKWCRENHLD